MTSKLIDQKYVQAIEIRVMKTEDTPEILELGNFIQSRFIKVSFCSFIERIIKNLIGPSSFIFKRFGKSLTQFKSKFTN